MNAPQEPATMELPPGPRHLLKLLPALILPCLAVYLGLSILVFLGLYALPLWFMILVSVLARPIFFITGVYYNRWKTEKAAVALGAVLPPEVEEWSFLTIKDMSTRMKEGYPAELFSEFTDKYGPVFRMNLLNEALLTTSEPEHIKAVLTTQFESFERGPLFHEQMESLFGSGVFNIGQLWKFHRSMTRPFFSRERLSDFEIFNRNCDKSLRIARSHLEEGFSIDFQDVVSRFALDSATEFLVGQNVGSLDAGISYPPSRERLNPRAFYDHPSTAFVEAVSQGQILSVPRISYGSDWPLWEFWKDAVKPKRDVLNSFTDPLILQALDNRKKELEAGIETKGEDVTLLDHLVKSTRDHTIIQDELINLLIAGKDTTGSLLTFSMYMLTQHPEIEKRLRQEIYDKVGPENPPTYAHMREMKYMRAFLNEVLRLYPPVPVNARYNSKATTLPASRVGQSPIYVRAKTTFVYSVMIMQRRKDLWGPDADKFDPDRFLDDRLAKYLIPNPHIFSPFNAGPRVCLGQQFAYHEATFFLVRLLQKFTGFTFDDALNAPPAERWAKCADRKATEKVFPMVHLTMYVKGGLWVKMKNLQT